MELPIKGWDLANPTDIPEVGNNYIDTDAVPYINTDEAWNQYTDEALYDLDKRMRSWMEKMSENKTWVRSAKSRRYTYKQLFEVLYQRPYTNKDAKYTGRFSKVFAYYSSRIQNAYWSKEKGRAVAKKNYTIAPGRLKKPPYSLRLRMEWLSEQGRLPNHSNMQLPSDNLTAGHARNPRTEANMRKRSEEKKRQYNERYSDRKR